MAQAVVLGVLWIRDPTGPLEPVISMVSLVGGSIIELVRRRLPDQKPTESGGVQADAREVLDHLNALRLQVHRSLRPHVGETKAQIYSEVAEANKRIKVYLNEQGFWIRSAAERAKLPAALSATAEEVAVDVSKYFSLLEGLARQNLYETDDGRIRRELTRALEAKKTLLQLIESAIARFSEVQ